MRGTMGQQGIKVTGNHEIDQAASEIAGHVRDGRVGSHVHYSDQDHYDTATDLRDRILRAAHYGLIRELAQNYASGLLSAGTAMDAIAAAVLSHRPEWRVAVNGTSKRPYFLIRGWGVASDQVPLPERYYNTPAGELHRYGSSEAAQKVADRLNAAEAS